MNCPRCNSRVVGRIGADQFYCWDCCVEFVVTRKGVQVFQVDDEGELVSVQGDAPTTEALT